MSAAGIAANGAANSAAAGENLKADLAEVRRALALLCKAGEVYELRALPSSKGIVSGYFTDFDKLAQSAVRCSDQVLAGGVYITLNPVKRDLLARASNRVKTFAKHTSGDTNVAKRCWLPIDLDPDRPPGISATDGEHQSALERAMKAREMLTDMGWPEPIFADSGNGAHLSYAIDLPNDDASRELVKRVLEALDSLIGNKAIKVDKTTFNAARIWKLYGTIARKGDSTADRPHRLARILEAPATLQIVTREQLEEVAHLLLEALQTGSSNSTTQSNTQSNFDLDKWVAEHGIAVVRESSWGVGRRLILDHCVFDPSHGGTTAAILQFPSGAVAYKCQHNGCADRKWADVWKKFEPGYREQRAASHGPDIDELQAARWRIAEIDRTLSADISGAYCVEYLTCAAIVSEQDPQCFERLKTNLKARGVSVSNWHGRVKEFVRKRAAEAKAVKDAAKAAAKAAPPPPMAEPAPEPWPSPVDGLTLLNDLQDYLSKFIVLASDGLTAVVLWIVFTFMIDFVDIAPRLALTSATRRCGKTFLLDLFGKLVLKPLAASNVSPASIYRIMEAEHCTLLIDEFDAVKRGSERAEETRGILNSGWTRGTAFVVRQVKVGDDFVSKRFSTFGAYVVAAIGKLPDTLFDRSIAVLMKRKTPAQKKERLIRRNKWAHQKAAELARQIQRFVSDNKAALEAAEPTLPNGPDDRALNNWEPLLAIAELAGGDWPKLARQAAVKLQSGRDDSGSLGELLLVDIKTIFDARQKPSLDFADRITSADLCAALADMEARPWVEYGRSRKPLTQPQLARLLANFSIAPGTIRLRDATAKGYYLKAFEEVFSSYGPINPLSDRNTVTTAGGEGESGDYQTVTEPECDGLENFSKSNGEKGCDGVPAENEKIRAVAEKDAEIDRLAHADGWDGTTPDIEVSGIAEPAITPLEQLLRKTSREGF